MTEPMFFDTDGLCAFLWVNGQNILTSLYPGRIVLPKAVYDELCKPGIPQLKRRANKLLENEEISIGDIVVGTPEYELYYKFTHNPESGHPIIGKGEAAALALASVKGGLIASNNLRDVKKYVAELSLKNLTTGDILTEAYEKGLITLPQGDELWAKMLAKRRKIGASSFTEYLKLHST